MRVLLLLLLLLLTSCKERNNDHYIMTLKSVNFECNGDVNDSIPYFPYNAFLIFEVVNLGYDTLYFVSNFNKYGQEIVGHKNYGVFSICAYSDTINLRTNDDVIVEIVKGNTVECIAELDSIDFFNKYSFPSLKEELFDLFTNNEIYYIPYVEDYKSENIVSNYPADIRRVLISEDIALFFIVNGKVVDTYTK
ncbi:hypothetical protein V6R21_08935 [Limibacter armeniacum]|uniref:hypothetical protein n=1 Tax=Limibacter armeniacum TaxID=466084 RepID=UPI002FE5F27E